MVSPSPADALGPHASTVHEVLAKVVRDRAMRRLDAVYPSYDFVSHVGYITPGHSAIVRRLGPSAIHRRSFDARCYAETENGPVESEVAAARA